MILTVLFWILFILSFIGCFFAADHPVQRPSRVILLILIGILGLKVFGSPLN